MSVLAAVLDLLGAAACAGCGASHAVVRELCPSCRGELLERAPLSGPAVPETLPGQVPLPVFAAAAYDGAVRAALLAYKERGRHGLRAELGHALFLACLALLCARQDGPPALWRSADSVLLVPAPSGRATVRARGHDAVRGIAAEAVAWLRGVQLPSSSAPVLRQARAVADQAGLTSHARAANLAGALAVRRPRVVADAAVIVVDDIVTTGATAGEAARALGAAGASVIGVAAVALTPRRLPTRARDAPPGASDAPADG